MIEELNLDDLVGFDSQTAAAIPDGPVLLYDGLGPKAEDREDVFKNKAFFHEELHQYSGQGFLE